MAIKPILTFPNNLLRKRAMPIKEINQEVKELIFDMKDTLKEASGVGLAANQIGVLKRVIVLNIPGQTEMQAYINPEIINKYGSREVSEGCLSFPNYSGIVNRSAKVTARYLDEMGGKLKITAEDLLSQAIEHEIDHLNGILFIDHLKDHEKLINSELEKLKEYIEFNESEINLNQLVHDKFIKSNFTLSVAESCSSGIIASELTSNAGSSKYFSGGIIAYSDKIKQDILDIDKEIIKKQSSVCSDVAKLMVENVAKKFSSDFSISTTGYASPSNDKNITVGKVFIGIKTPHSLFVEEFLFSGDRKIIIQQVKDKALELLLNEIKKIK